MQPDLESMTVPQLKELAKTAQIPKFDSMKKAELIAALSPVIGVDPAQPGADKTVETLVDLSSSEKSDYSSHPKFSKFNSAKGVE